MVAVIQGPGLMVKLKVQEKPFLQTEHFMKVILKMPSSMGWAKSFIMTVIPLMANGLMA